MLQRRSVEQDLRVLPGLPAAFVHRHPAFVLYAVDSFEHRIHLPDGKVLMRELEAGDLMVSPAQMHIGENVGNTSTHVIMVELKTAVQP